MRESSFIKRLSVSPAALAISAVVGLGLGAALFVLVVMRPGFQGDYLRVLPFAAIPIVLGFLLAWGILAVFFPGFGGKKPESLSPAADPPGTGQPDVIARLRAMVGPEQAAVIGRLHTSKSWTIEIKQNPDRTLNVFAHGRAVTDDQLGDDLGAVSIVTGLNLAGCPITDKGLARLGEKPYLGVLTLTWTKVTDAGLVHLSRLPRLQKLDVENTKVTDDGLRSAGLFEKKFSIEADGKKLAIAAASSFQAVPMPPAISEPFARAARLTAEAKFSEAEPFAQAALAAVPPADHNQTQGMLIRDRWEAKCLMMLALIEIGLRKLAEAQPRLRRALEFDEKHLGPDHPEVSLILWNLGYLGRMSGNALDAEDAMKRSLAIREKGSEDTSGNHTELALLYTAQGKAEGVTHHRKAVEVLEAKLAAPGGDTLVVRAKYAHYLRTFASLLRRGNRGDEADALEARAQEIAPSARP